MHRDRKYRDGYPDDDDDEGHSDEGDTLVDLSDENTRRTSLSSTGDNCRGNSSDEENHDNDFDGNNLDDDMTLGRGAGGCLCCLGLSVLCCRCCSRCEPCKCCNAPKYQFTRLLFRVMGQGWRAQTLSRALSALNTCVIVFSIILIC